MMRLFAVHSRTTGHDVAGFFPDKRSAKGARDMLEGPEIPENPNARQYCVTRGPDHRHFRERRAYGA